VLLAIGIRFLSLIFLQFREMFFKLFAAFINAKLPSGLFEPLGLLLSVSFGLGFAFLARLLLPYGGWPAHCSPRLLASRPRPFAAFANQAEARGEERKCGGRGVVLIKLPPVRSTPGGSPMSQPSTRGPRHGLTQ
jgi:hypothetical protein